MSKIILTFAFFLILNLTFAQKTASWLRYPKISPSGEKVAFSYQGNIFVVSSKGGLASLITNGDSYNYSPIWSPDGKKIAFASNRNGSFDIFIVDYRGGTPKRLTFSSTSEIPTSFSPDGKNILFKALIQDVYTSASFPKPYLHELYSVPAEGGNIRQILSSPAEYAQYSSKQDKIYYQDLKGGENYWRKHHRSSVTKDIWVYDTKNKTHKKLTNFEGEDRTPALYEKENIIYFTTERFNDNFNIAKMKLDGSNVEQVTNLKNHPVRFLSISENETLCFSYNGKIYIKEKGKTEKMLNIQVFFDSGNMKSEFVTETSGASEISVSPSGKEIAFILHGNVFVTSTKYSVTKQITNTAEEERGVSFSPDGKTLLYASERNGKWGIYTTKMGKDDKYFVKSTSLSEELIIDNEEDVFQPKYSPNGKEIAFLENKTILKVFNIKTKKQREVLAKNYNFSYADGDQSYKWSPDSKYFLAKITSRNLFVSDVAIVKADGKSKPINLTNSGYSDDLPKWQNSGSAMIWLSDRSGFRNHGSWGAMKDVYMSFFNEDDFNKFTLSEEEYALQKNDDTPDSTNNKEFDFENFDDRTVRLTHHSSDILDMILSKNGEKLFYLTKFQKGYDLWVTDLRKNETKIALKLRGGGGSMQLDSTGANLFMFSGGRILKINTKTYKKSTVSFKAEYMINFSEERKYIFSHIKNQMEHKFYRKNMHNVDWEFYCSEYEKFLPEINNKYDFAELESELLGELNASHTGCYYFARLGGDSNSQLGGFYDFSFTGKGVKIDDVVKKSPLSKTKIKITKGVIIEKINGKEIIVNQDLFKFLNHTIGKPIFVSFYNPKTNKRWSETIKPISKGVLFSLLYDRWVENMEKQTEILSGGKLAYVHVKGMNSSSYRAVYSKLLGKYEEKDAVIIDTRYNGGGWLHDDLATLFSGEVYVNYVPRGQNFGHDPYTKWTKPSILLVNEGNYSDAHAFPYVYKTLKLGKIVGMPVPGTTTAVRWEKQIDKSLKVGYPEVGVKNMKGEYLENNQLEPDFKVENKQEDLIQNIDQQLKKAVELLLKK